MNTNGAHLRTLGPIYTKWRLVSVNKVNNNNPFDVGPIVQVTRFALKYINIL